MVTDAGPENTSWIWDIQTGERITAKDGCWGRPAWSPDGRWVVNPCRAGADSDTAYHVWDPLTGEVALFLDKGDGDHHYRSFFSPDGRYLLTPHSC
jgi:WD40 repeat protein